MLRQPTSLRVLVVGEGSRAEPIARALGLVPESRLAEELLRPGLDRDRDVGRAGEDTAAGPRAATGPA